ncbi:MAG: CapA family protein [Spirochaetes bacterium]|nr:CapA family protein [Spirochaetota bacterium]
MKSKILTQTFIFILLSSIYIIFIVKYYKDISKTDSFTLVAVGDLVHSSYSPFKNQYITLGKKMYAGTRAVIQSGDLSFVNLEGPFTTRRPTAKKPFSFSVNPSELKDILWAGFNLFSQANNHIADAGTAGILDSISNLRSTFVSNKPFHWAGIGRNKNEAEKPVIFKLKEKNIKFAFLAYSYSKHPLVNTFSKEKAIKDIRNIRDADVIIVSVHYGHEFEHIPRPYIVEAYRALIDAGASIVFGHHPHVPQGIEYYKKRLIFYSLGDYSVGAKPDPRYIKGGKFYGMIVKILFKKRRAFLPSALTVYPMYVDNTSPMIIGKYKLRVKPFTPRIVRKPFSSVILKSIKDWSDKIPGNNIKFKIDGNIMRSIFKYGAKPF